MGKKKKQAKKIISNQSNKKKKSPQKKHSKNKNKVINKQSTLNQENNQKKEKTKEPLKKKSFRRNKSSKKPTTQNKQSIIKLSYLWWLLLGTILIMIGISLLKKPQSVKQLQKPTPQKLDTIQGEDKFVKIKVALLPNSTTNNKLPNAEFSQINVFNTHPQQTVSLPLSNNKYLAILKRGKIFIINTSTNKYVSKIEISPIPKREKDAVLYDKLFVKENILFASGYRQTTKSLEIASFKISSSGIIARGNTYDLPSDNTYNNTVLSNNKLIIYTSRDLSSVSFNDISNINTWDKKTSTFISDNVHQNKIVFDNNNLPANPLLHSFTACQIQEETLINCHQTHLLDDKINSSYINSDNIYFWITQKLSKENPQRIIPNSRLYNLSLIDYSLQMIQVEGAPINRTSLGISTNRIQATIYQNNTLPPAWHQNFKNKKIAISKFSLDDFKEEGDLLIDKDNYTLLNENFTSDDDIVFIIATNNLIKISQKESTITIINEEEGSKKIEINGNIVLTKKIPNTNNIIIFFKNKNNLYSQIINSDNTNSSNELLLTENIKPGQYVLKDEINSFMSNKSLLISIALINDTNNIGNVHLLSLNKNTLEKVYTLPFKKTYQLSRDNCQNGCQQDWKNLVRFFPTENNKLYVLTGSYLKSFYWNKLNKLQLAKTINYTLKPAPPKPKRPAARIPVGAKVVNGKYVCKKKHDYVGKSKRRNKGYLHLDMECCLDPDEYPNPWCTYRPGELSVTKLRYADYHGNIKRKKK